MVSIVVQCVNDPIICSSAVNHDIRGNKIPSLRLELVTRNAVSHSELARKMSSHILYCDSVSSSSSTMTMINWNGQTIYHELTPPLGNHNG
ncbi:hypothetical protein BLOT_008922 [Blomia tropicalis]|nr:hypothetical protein BLOT_008922 [Blomia tropicalis]